MEGVDQLQLAWIEREGKRYLSISINGVALDGCVSAFEKTQFGQSLGDGFVVQADARDHILPGLQRSAQPTGVGRLCYVRLLACNCGDIYCSSLYVESYTDDQWVVWRRLGTFNMAVYRGDYESLGTWVFERNAYRKEIEAVYRDMLD